MSRSRRIHDRYKRWSDGTAKARRKNRELCKRYPFLIERDYRGNPVWYGKKKYSTTWLDDMPVGWRKSFGLMLCEEMRAELLKFNYLDKYRIVQIKEKYGQLRIYDNGIPHGCKAWDIIEKYSHISENVCIGCGKPDTPMINPGWYSPLCLDCYRKTYEKRIDGNNIEQSYENCKCDDGIIPDTYSYLTGASKDIVVVDITETVQAVRYKWRMEHSDYGNKINK